MKFDYKIGEIVGINNGSVSSRPKAVILGVESNNLFESVRCVKIMIIGDSKPTYTLSDRICKL